MAFHPYPQLIPPVFNLGGCGPPRGFTRASTWPWIDHFASGLEHATTGAHFGLAFATAPPHGLTSPHATNSQAHSSKGTLSPQLRRLRRIVSTRFQVLFHSPPGVLFTFPSRYLSAIGHQVVFRLTKWSWQIRTGFLGPRTTWDTHQEVTQFRLRESHPLCLAFQDHSTTTSLCNSLPARQNQSTSPTTPQVQRLPAITHPWFSLFRFRSPLLTEYLFLRVLRCFTSPRSLRTPYIFRRG